MEIQYKINLRKQILKELYLDWEKGGDFVDKINEIGTFKNISDLDLDRQIKYLEDKGYIKIYGKFIGQKYLNFHGCRITDYGIDLIENKEEFNHLFKIEVNNISDINNSVVSIGNNNKIENINNEIDNIIELLDKNKIERKEYVKGLLEEFKKTEDRSKLIDIFNILGNGASINSMIIALSNLIN